VADAILIAGPNGAGKTTFARQVLRMKNPSMIFLNADEIQKERPSLANPIAAGRELLLRLDALEEAGASFAVETTLSSGLYARRIEKWAEIGYHTTLHFIELPSADYAVERVAARVEAGGHFVPEVDIRRRFDRGLHLFATVFKPLPDRWYHWFSDEGGLRLVDQAPK
jgi:predicted ABC-type ATPase